MKHAPETSWHKIGKWYDRQVGSEGHYYHQTLIIPKVLHLLNFTDRQPASLLDLACGQGVLSRHIPEHVSYVGVDAAPSLIAAAKKYGAPPSHQFVKGDIAKELKLAAPLFTHCTIILALQNIENALPVFQNANRYLQKNGRLVLVLNHPCFRIPRQSSWQIDADQKVRYRRIDRYMTPMKIPIQTHPGKGKDSPQTLSFHHPLSDYSKWLKEAGFMIELVEEWCSNKSSQGKAAKMENRSRAEIPLFMALKALKQG